MWYSQQVGIYIGAIGGTIIGIWGGLFGTIVGLTARHGVGRRFVISSTVISFVLGFVLLAAGITALCTKQPYHVWYPLILGGFILSTLFGVMFFVIRNIYRHVELRQMELKDKISAIHQVDSFK